MKKLKIAAAVIVGLFLLVTAAGFLAPATMHVERSVLVSAPPAAIYPLIADLPNGWPQWNPFDDEDPAIRYAYSGPAVGVGATQAWDSKEIGDGRMTITKADPERGVETDLLLMQESFRLTGSLLCEPAGNQTKLTWSGEQQLGSNPYRRLLNKVVVEPLIGSAFQKGIDTVKQKVESSANVAAGK